jgi:low affinity Fe/Cu permease
VNLAVLPLVLTERTRTSEIAPLDQRIENLALIARKRGHPPTAVERMAGTVTEWTGRTSAFMWALTLVVAWIISGPLFHFSDSWQLVINTVTNLVTFLMVFLIQRAQNKDTLALQIKVNELIAAHQGPHNSVIAIEQLSEDELRLLEQRILTLARLSQRGDVSSMAPVAEDSRRTAKTRRP